MCFSTLPSDNVLRRITTNDQIFTALNCYLSSSLSVNITSEKVMQVTSILVWHVVRFPEKSCGSGIREILLLFYFHYIL